MRFITVALGAWSFLGTALTIYFGLANRRLNRIKNSLTWKEIESGSLHLLKKAEAKFKPDILLMTSGPGAIIASLAMIQARRFYPVYTAILEDKRGAPFGCKPKGHVELSTTKWKIHLPEQLKKEKDRRIMIIDDCVISGDVHQAICEFLQKIGFPRNNIFFASLVCSNVALQTEKEPELYSYENPHKHLFFPWGRWF